MEYNDFDFLAILSIYNKPISLRTLLYHLEPNGIADEAAYADAMWLVAALEQDGLVTTSGGDEDLLVRLTEHGRNLSELMATAIANRITEDWYKQQMALPRAAGF